MESAANIGAVYMEEYVIVTLAMHETIFISIRFPLSKTIMVKSSNLLKSLWGVFFNWSSSSKLVSTANIDTSTTI